MSSQRSQSHRYIGELLVPLELRGSESLGASLAASRVRGFLALGVSSPAGESFAVESGSLSCGALYDSQG
jgi:hypothetical protein